MFYFCFIDEGTKGQKLKKKKKLVQLANNSKNWSPSWHVSKINTYVCTKTTL